MARQTVYIERNPFSKIKEGVDAIADVVKVTLGPAGKNVLLPQGENDSKSTRDGVTVANSINLKDRLANYGAREVLKAARETNAHAGDGTTTATVLAQAIFANGLKYIAAGVNPNLVKTSVDKAVEKAIENLKHIKREVKGKDIEAVATISANNDNFIGKLIAEAVEKVGEKGSVLVENSTSHKTHVKFQEGMVVDRGWADYGPFFITNLRTRTIEYDNPRFVIIDDNIHNFEQILPIVRIIAKDRIPTIFMVRDMEDVVVGFLAKNKLEGGLPIALLKTVGYNNPELIEDFANRIAAPRYFNPNVHPLNTFTPQDFGMAKRIIIRASDATIIEGNGDISERLSQLNEAVKGEEDPITKGRLQDRINRLTNAVAILCVAAESETEMQDKKLRIEDAINATKAAVAEGIVSGGGTALLAIRDTSDEHSIGKDIVNSALEYPIRTIISNAGENVEKILAQINEDYGYDAKNKVMGNMFDLGIIDPVKVTRTALQKAASVAGMLLTAGAAVVYDEEIK